MKTNAELHRVNPLDHIEEIAKMCVCDISGSHVVPQKLIYFLKGNVEMLEKIGFNNYNGLRYNNEEKYDELIDLIEEEKLDRNN